MTTNGKTRSGTARRRRPGRDPGPADAAPWAATDDTMAIELTAGFAAAARRAVQQAQAEGLAVPARLDGVAFEVRPNGDVVPIDDDAAWSPLDWRKAVDH